MSSSLHRGSLILYAPTIHRGGGKVLLDALLESVPKSAEIVCVLDRRYAPSKAAQIAIAGLDVHFAGGGGALGRLRAEWLLRSLSKGADRVLCLGNLPPLFACKAPVHVFLQNRNLLSKAELSDFELPFRAHQMLQRAWMRWRRRNAQSFIVQTPSMARGLADDLDENTKIEVLPFVPGEFLEPRSRTGGLEADFVYISSGEPHKNHRNLLLAWELLAREGHFPSLVLTLEEEWIRSFANSRSLKILLRPTLDRKGVWKLLGASRALIFPSLHESFGLPLIEADRVGLPILAPELDYVREVVRPAETFDPHSPVSIARAVKRFLKLNEPTLKIHAPSDFLKHFGVSNE